MIKTSLINLLYTIYYMPTSSKRHFSVIVKMSTPFICISESSLYCIPYFLAPNNGNSDYKTKHLNVILIIHIIWSHRVIMYVYAFYVSYTVLKISLIYVRSYQNLIIWPSECQNLHTFAQFGLLSKTGLFFCCFFCLLRYEIQLLTVSNYITQAIKTIIK